MRVLCIGASLTAGWTRDGVVFHPYGHRLLELLNRETPGVVHQVEVAGVPGEDTAGIRIRLYILLRDAKRSTTPYDWVVLLAGTNDLCRDARTSDILDNLAEMREMVLECNDTTRLVHLTIPEIHRPEPGSREAQRGCPIDVERKRVNDALKHHVRALQDDDDETRVTVCDVANSMPQYTNASSQQLSNWWDEDKIHLSPRGYNHVAELVYQCMFSSS